MILRRYNDVNLDVIIKNINSKNSYKNFFLFVMGMLIGAISVSVFYEPNDVVTNGSTGLAILISHYFNMDLSLIILLLSSILLMFGFAIFGIKYGTKNILGTFLFPIFVKAATLINKVISLNDVSLFILIVIGGLLSGISFGLIKRSGYTLGGFYVLYDFLYDKFKISVGKASLICNCFVIFLGYFVFGIDKCIYSMIGLYISSTMADRVMLGISRSKAFYIITKKPLDVRDYIIDNFNYTVTIVNARGGFSNKKKKMLLCVIPTTMYAKLKDVIRQIDKEAFFLITDCYSVSK